MSERLQAVSPLGGAIAEEGLACRIEDAGALGMITLRGDFASAVLRDAAAKAGGTDFPAERKMGGSAERGLAWMSPDEVMIFLQRGAVASTLAAIGDALKDAHHQAVDVSDARAVLRLTGAAAREILAKGAPIDLSRTAFGAGDFRRTRLGQVAVAFWQVNNDPEIFEIMCFRSVSGFVFEWLKTAARSGSTPEFL